jgi:steroid 5-alpha reductase family enzyme
MAMEQLLLTNLGAIAAAITLLWLISLIKRDASVVDIFWGSGFVLVAWLTFAMHGVASARSLVLLALVSVWGLRLSSYLAWRNWGKPEDYRYRAMRERHGTWFPLVSLATVFVLQALLMWVISLPIQVGIAGAKGWHLAATVGVLLWLFGFLFESVGDFQLARFKSNPANRGRVMNRGLWRYTRHPNYFGDFLVWWGFYCLALESGSWWWTITSPLLMSFLLIRVSGVRLLESSLRRRVTGYEQYVRSTSAFVPLPPKREN